MYCYRLTFLISALLMALAAFAQDYPTASPKMIIDTEDGEEETQAYSGSAPIAAHLWRRAVRFAPTAAQS